MIALLYDVHGNLPALEAVLADAGGQGASGWLVGGDVALFGPYPVETVERLRALDGAVWIRGNTDRWTEAPGQAPDNEVVQGAIAAARAVLEPEIVRWLGALPPSHLVAAGERAWHGSPVSDVRSFLPEAAPDEAELLEGVTERRLIFGHTHLPFRRGAGAIELVNPGSVGMPLDGDHRAAYALRHPDGAIEHRRVDYDRDAAIAALRERFDGPWTDAPLHRLTHARMETSS